VAVGRTGYRLECVEREGFSQSHGEHGGNCRAGDPTRCLQKEKEGEEWEVLKVTS